MARGVAARKQSIKLQSAMEYLMTYGWAILIISVVLGVLFQMGVFNSSSLSVRIPPGACQVLRTSAAVNLVGQCSGILPQYVAQFNGPAASKIGNIPDGRFPSGTSPVSIFAWINSNQSAWVPFVVQYGNAGTSYQNWILEDGYVSWADTHASVCVDTWNTGQCAGPLISDNKWHLIGFTYAGGTSITLYTDGIGTTVATLLSNVAANTLSGTYAQIGGGTTYYTGSISNVQIYNSSLSSSQVQALYQEGIGGAPVDPSHLVGWWPLNGDTKDYSGNGNNGAATAITYVSQYGK